MMLRNRKSQKYSRNISNTDSNINSNNYTNTNRIGGDSFGGQTNEKIDEHIVDLRKSKSGGNGNNNTARVQGDALDIGARKGGARARKKGI